jgi:hypothetical protein
MANESAQAKAPLDEIGGWLWFLIASLIALGPILTVVTTALELSNAETLYPTITGSSLWQTAQIIAWCSVAVYCLISIYAGVRLLRKHVPSSVAIAILCLWLAGPLLSLAGLYALAEAGGEPNAADVGAAVGRPLVWATLWTLYLIFSKRVRQTYYGGSSIRSAVVLSWKGLGRRPRQLMFFSICWVVVFVLYFQVIAPPDPYPQPEEVRRMWAIILLPPVLTWLGSIGYARFVGSED